MTNRSAASLHRSERAARLATVLVSALSVLAACAGVLAVLFAPAARAAETRPALVLKADIAAAGDLVRLSDFFVINEETSEHAAFARPVLRAPAPGESVFVDAAYVSDALRGTGYYWPNMENLARIEVRRAARIVTREEMIATVREALIARGFSPDARITLDKAPASLSAPLEDDTGLEVVQLAASGSSGRFTARLKAWRGGEMQALVGKALVMTQIIVPARPLARGEVLDESDLEPMDVPAKRAPAGAITRYADIVGMALKRPLTAGSPIRAGDLEAPRLVERGGLVTINYEVAGLRITAIGKALEAGAKNDVVAIENLKSERTVRAIITARNTVSVMTPSAFAALQTALN